jgi:hypothetical protein
MDKGRRDLYVEGTRDGAFLRWLAGRKMAPKTAVISIDFVDMPQVDEGGNRERLKEFLSLVGASDYEIRGLLDADQSRLVGEEIPTNTWLTDLRDAESYVLDVENIDAALRLGCGIERGVAEAVLSSTFDAAISISAIRLASHKLDLRLPVSKSRLKGYVTSTPAGVLSIDEPGYLGALLQSGKVSLARLEEVAEAVAAAKADLAAMPRREVVHGKDCMKLLTIQFRALGASDLREAAPLLWSSFKRERLSEYPILQEIEEYLTKV